MSSPFWEFPGHHSSQQIQCYDPFLVAFPIVQILASSNISLVPLQVA
jgi:hypothetical protein